MLTIHHLGHSQSERIIWLCEELGVHYELVRYERDPVTIFSPPALKALHSLGAAPVIQDDGLLLAESAAIIEYIIAKQLTRSRPIVVATFSMRIIRLCRMSPTQ